MNFDLSCSSCRQPLAGGHIFGLWTCLNEQCEEHGKQIALKPMAKPHPFTSRKWQKRRAA